MSAAARSIFVFGSYLAVVGVGFLLAPNAILPLLSVERTDEVWIRVVGMLVIFLGIYYMSAARAEARFFFRATVPVRLSVLLFFAGFILLDMAPAVLMIFAVVDAMGALWTATALRANSIAASTRGP